MTRVVLALEPTNIVHVVIISSSDEEFRSVRECLFEMRGNSGIGDYNVSDLEEKVVEAT